MRIGTHHTVRATSRRGYEQVGEPPEPPITEGLFGDGSVDFDGVVEVTDEDHGDTG
jgi:hypothetical protein